MMSSALTKHEKVVVVDFGSQVTKLIARRLREFDVLSEVIPCTSVNEVSDIVDCDPKAIIFSGGPESVLEEGSPSIPMGVFDLGIPILGICYGQQLLVHLLGGKVESGSTEDGDHSREFGKAILESCTDEDLAMTKNLFQEEEEIVWMSHGDTVTSIPESFQVIAKSQGAPFAMVGDLDRQFFGVQFHPEVTHTRNGGQMLRNFVFDVAGCTGDWTMTAYRQEMIEKIREQIKPTDHIICGVSGGVDSTVTAKLLHDAVPDQVSCVFIDHGFMRLNEADQVVAMFDSLGIPLTHSNESERFLTALEGLTDPEDKRKAIGSNFIDSFLDIAKSLDIPSGQEITHLGQGTLYPDVIESPSTSSSKSHTIKSHHNVGGLPEKMKLKLVEPLRELFKDEVRRLGAELNLPSDFLKRHPFPGPGLAIRVPEEVTVDKLDTLRLADDIFIDQIRKHDLYDEVWQALAILLPVNTVGVMGDQRTFEAAVVLRAVTSVDGMTAESYHFTSDFLSETMTRIINEVNGVNRVLFDITSKPPGTIEWY